MTDEMVAAIPKFRESALFTPAEKAALRLADAMAGDHKQAPYDEIFADLRKYYSEEQIVALAGRPACGWVMAAWSTHSMCLLSGSRARFH